MNDQIRIEAPANVYGKIAAVQAALAKTGIGKDSDNVAQKYKFRGIDAVYNALAPLLAAHGLCILPRMVGRTREERVTVKTWNGEAKESVTFYVTVEAEFDFVSADDGSIHVVRTYGEAMDNGDKATNKAMSAAYKYAAFMAFAIPTEGDNDAGATMHEVASKPAMPDAEWSRLVQLIQASKADRQKMLQHFGVPDLRQLNMEQYAEALDMLDAKLAKLAKAETDAKAKVQPTLAEELNDSINF